jgi:hypothetical protein
MHQLVEDLLLMIQLIMSPSFSLRDGMKLKMGSTLDHKGDLETADG